MDLLPIRVSKVMRQEADFPKPSAPAATRGDWLLQPYSGMRDKWTGQGFSPTQLRAYLACPTSFFFARVLRWDKFDPFDGELDAGGFGDMVHLVLQDWGANPAARDLSEEDLLRECWLDLLSSHSQKRFGKQPPPLIQLQLLSAAERLEALAKRQAEQRVLGWRIRHVEKELNGVLSLAGLPLNMKVDRIDQNEKDSSWRVVDYKTGKTSKAPSKSHLALWNKEKYPNPLSSPLVVSAKKAGKDKEYIWKDPQLPLYAEAVRIAEGLNTLPKTCYALLPAATGDTCFKEFEELDTKIQSAMQWAEAAAQAIRRGVFWPPAPQSSFDPYASMAPEGLEKALGPEWQKILMGGSS
jgi:ATP-dependent helicase/nuclease subunit B